MLVLGQILACPFFFSISECRPFLNVAQRDEAGRLQGDRTMGSDWEVGDIRTEGSPHRALLELAIRHDGEEAHSRGALVAHYHDRVPVIVVGDFAILLATQSKQSTSMDSEFSSARPLISPPKPR